MKQQYIINFDIQIVYDKKGNIRKAKIQKKENLNHTKITIGTLID